MALVNLRDMLEHAYRHHYAVGGFDLVSLDFLEAIFVAAERQQAPVRRLRRMPNINIAGWCASQAAR